MQLYSANEWQIAKEVFCETRNRRVEQIARVGTLHFLAPVSFASFCHQKVCLQINLDSTTHPMHIFTEQLAIILIHHCIRSQVKIRIHEKHLLFSIRNLIYVGNDTEWDELLVDETQRWLEPETGQNHFDNDQQDTDDRTLFAQHNWNWGTIEYW